MMLTRPQERDAPAGSASIADRNRMIPVGDAPKIIRVSDCRRRS
jgi:hypothetical protein